ncbi:MAG: hypothetical protein ABL961_15365, partial [Vicinamibacterales bacterium]
MRAFLQAMVDANTSADADAVATDLTDPAQNGDTTDAAGISLVRAVVPPCDDLVVSRQTTFRASLRGRQSADLLQVAGDPGMWPDADGALWTSPGASADAGAVARRVTTTTTTTADSLPIVTTTTHDDSESDAAAYLLMIATLPTAAEVAVVSLPMAGGGTGEGSSVVENDTATEEPAPSSALGPAPMAPRGDAFRLAMQQAHLFSAPPMDGHRVGLLDPIEESTGLETGSSADGAFAHQALAAGVLTQGSLAPTRHSNPLARALRQAADPQALDVPLTTTQTVTRALDDALSSTLSDSGRGEHRDGASFAG